MKIQTVMMLLLQFTVLEIKIKQSSGMPDYSNTEVFEFGIFENFLKTKDILLQEETLIKALEGERGKIG